MKTEEGVGPERKAILDRVVWFIETFQPLNSLTFGKDLLDTIDEAEARGRNAGLKAAAVFIRSQIDAGDYIDGIETVDGILALTAAETGQGVKRYE